MDTIGAFMRGQMARAAGNKMMVFDWDRAAQIIRERGAIDAGAGLSGDWEWTGGAIFRDGAPVPKEDTYVYLASLWARPELEVNHDTLDCWKYAEDTPGWDEHTYWPASALAILAGRAPASGTAAAPAAETLGSAVGQGPAPQGDAQHPTRPDPIHSTQSDDGGGR